MQLDQALVLLADSSVSFFAHSSFPKSLSKFSAYPKSTIDDKRS